MRKSRPKYPKPANIAITKIALEWAIPVDVPLAMGWRESGKLVPNFRFAGLTGGRNWVVDVYSGGYYYVQAGPFCETVHSMPAVLRFLKVHLAEGQ